MLKSRFKIYLDVVHIKLRGGRGGLGVLGVLVWIEPPDQLGMIVFLALEVGDGGDEDEEREGIRSRKAELEQKLTVVGQVACPFDLGDGRREKGNIIAVIWWYERGKRCWGWWTSIQRRY